jgi:uncharacterized protein YndB with AHSA1/START domain
MKESMSDRELIFNRVLDAPRELVFKAWTDPDHVVKWWGPNGFTNTNHGMDVSENGVWRFTMHGPDGVDYKNKIVFLEVVKPERLVYKHCDDEDTESITFHVTVTFEAKGNKTDLTMCMVFDSKEELERVAREYGAIEGAHQHIARLEAYVSGKNILVHPAPYTIERTLKAPAEMVWKAITEKERMKEWYFDLKKFIPQKGFEFRFYGGHEDGIQYEHVCIITDVIQGEKLTYSWRYKGYAGISFVTFELFAKGDKTLLKLTHAGLESFPSDNPDFAKENFVEGWTHIIGTSLKDFLER